MSAGDWPEGKGESLMEPHRWWAEPFRTFQTNLREIDADLDVRRVVDTVVELGANAWLLNTGGIVSFYPSRLPFQRPSPWLSRRPSGDLIADAIAEAHARGIRLISRLDFSKIARDLAEEHPDWCFVDVEGRPQTFSGLYSTCPSAPYYQERALEVLDEILASYQVDGFFFNWFNFNQRDYSGRSHGICQCAHCRRRFAERHGLGLPRVQDWNDPAYLQWLAYTRDTLAELAARIRRMIGERAPGTALILRQDPDVIFQEVNNALSRPQPIWVEWAGEFGREAKAAEPDKPALVNTVLFLDLPYRFASEQPGFIALDLVQTMAHGANPSAYLVGTPDRLPKPTLDTVGTILRFHRDHADWYRGLRSAARVAVVSSPRSQEAYGADGEDRVLHERRGIHRALVDGHVPFDILPDEVLDAAGAAARLRAYDVVVLPNVATLDGPAAAGIDAYVKAGGGLVATYETATRDAGGARDTFALESLGARGVLRRQETPGALTSAPARARPRRPATACRLPPDSTRSGIPLPRPEGRGGLVTAARPAFAIRAAREVLLGSGDPAPGAALADLRQGSDRLPSVARRRALLRLEPPRASGAGAGGNRRRFTLAAAGGDQRTVLRRGRRLGTACPSTDHRPPHQLLRPPGPALRRPAARSQHPPRPRAPVSGSWRDLLTAWRGSDLCYRGRAGGGGPAPA